MEEQSKLICKASLTYTLAFAQNEVKAGDDANDADDDGGDDHSRDHDHGDGVGGNSYIDDYEDKTNLFTLMRMTCINGDDGNDGDDCDDRDDGMMVVMV